LLLPNPGDLGGDPFERPSDPWAERPGVADTVVQGHGELAEDVELELVVGGVADAHGSSASVTREPVEFGLGEASLAANAVHDLELRGSPADGIGNPLIERFRLLVKTGGDERSQRE